MQWLASAQRNFPKTIDAGSAQSRVAAIKLDRSIGLG
jgi:hypothetical protein